MKTTIEIPDGLLRRAKVAAAHRGVTLRELTIRGLEAVLEERAPVAAGLTDDEREYLEISPLTGLAVLKPRAGIQVREETVSGIREKEGI